MRTVSKRHFGVCGAQATHSCWVHVVIHPKLREPCHIIGSQTERQVSVAVSGTGLDSRPVLDLRQDNVDKLVHKFQRRRPVNCCLDTDTVTFLDLPLRNAVLHLHSRGSAAGDGLDSGSHDWERLWQLGRSRHECGDGDGANLGDVAESNILLEKIKVRGTSGATTRSVDVVRRRIVPLTQAIGLWCDDGAGHLVYVRQRQQVGGDRRVVRLLETRVVERPGNEVAGCRIGARRRLDGVEGATVVLGRMVLESRDWLALSRPQSGTPLTHLFPGSCCGLSSTRLAVLKDLTVASSGPGMAKPEFDSRSARSGAGLEVSEDAHRRVADDADVGSQSDEPFVQTARASRDPSRIVAAMVNRAKCWWLSRSWVSRRWKIQWTRIHDTDLKPHMGGAMLMSSGLIHPSIR